MNQPLFRMLWWLSVAPFGKPVVPLVYWMLIASSQPRSAIRARSSSSLVPSPAASSSSQSLVPSQIVRSSAGSSPRTSSTMAT